MTNVLSDEELFRLLPECCPTTRQVETELLVRAIQKQPIAEDLDDLPGLSRIAARLEPRTRDVFLQAVANTQQAMDLEALAQAIQSGQITRLEAAAQLERYREELHALGPPIQDGFLRGAAFAHQTLPLAVGTRLRFDLVNPHAVAFAQRHVPSLVTALSRHASAQLQTVLTSAANGEMTVDQAAREVRETLPMTERDTTAFRRFREEVFSTAGRTAAAVRRVERYRTALLRRRALVVARTELIRSANEGQQALWMEGVSQGVIDKATSTRRWLVTLDERLCPICEPLDRAETSLEAPFVQPVLGQTFARPPAHPQCRCAVVLVAKAPPQTRPLEAGGVSGGIVDNQEPRTLEAVTNIFNAGRLRHEIVSTFGEGFDDTKSTFRGIQWGEGGTDNHLSKFGARGYVNAEQKIVLEQKLEDQIKTIISIKKDTPALTAQARWEYIRTTPDARDAVEILTHEYQHTLHAFNTYTEMMVAYRSNRFQAGAFFEEALTELAARQSSGKVVEALVGRATDFVSLSRGYEVWTTEMSTLLKHASGGTTVVPTSAWKRALGKLKYKTDVFARGETLSNMIGYQYSWTEAQRTYFRRWLPYIADDGQQLAYSSKNGKYVADAVIKKINAWTGTDLQALSDPVGLSSRDIALLD